MNERQDRSVALISGGAGGIGLATARRLALDGYRVAISGRSDQRLQAARQVIVEHTGDPDACLTIPLDLEHDPSNAGSIVDLTYAHFGQLDVLVNNAAAASLGAFDEITDDAFESIINVNIRAIFYITRRAFQIMKIHREGVIINISSLASVDPFPELYVYGASKAWLETLTLGLAREAAELNILSYALRVGAVDTPMLRRLLPHFPLHDALQPSNVADAIAELLALPPKLPVGQAVVLNKAASRATQKSPQ